MFMSVWDDNLGRCHENLLLYLGKQTSYWSKTGEVSFMHQLTDSERYGYGDPKNNKKLA